MGNDLVTELLLFCAFFCIFPFRKGCNIMQYSKVNQFVTFIFKLYTLGVKLGLLTFNFPRNVQRSYTRHCAKPPVMRSAFSNVGRKSNAFGAVSHIPHTALSKRYKNKQNISFFKQIPEKFSLNSKFRGKITLPLLFRYILQRSSFHEFFYRTLADCIQRSGSLTQAESKHNSIHCPLSTILLAIEISASNSEF